MTLTKVEIKLDSKNLYIVRHGQTDYNQKGIVQGRGIDAPLNEKGQWQAKQFYERYKTIKFDKIYISTMLRTFQTVNGFIDSGVPYQKLEGLDEIDWGVWEGKSLNVDSNKYYSETIKKWTSGETGFVIEGGESPDMVRDRQLKALKIILDNKEEQRVLICMHGRAMRILFPTLLRVPLKDMDLFQHQNTCLYQFDYNGVDFRMLKENDVAHLDPDS